jgi:hypothetical protein
MPVIMPLSTPSAPLSLRHLLGLNNTLVTGVAGCTEPNKCCLPRHRVERSGGGSGGLSRGWHGAPTGVGGNQGAFSPQLVPPCHHSSPGSSHPPLSFTPHVNAPPHQSPAQSPLTHYTHDTHARHCDAMHACSPESGALTRVPTAHSAHMWWQHTYCSCQLGPWSSFNTTPAYLPWAPQVRCVVVSPCRGLVTKHLPAFVSSLKCFVDPLPITQHPILSHVWHSLSPTLPALTTTCRSDVSKAALQLVTM